MTQLTTNDLIMKIGVLTLELDIARGQVVELQAKLDGQIVAAEAAANSVSE